MFLLAEKAWTWAGSCNIGHEKEKQNLDCHVLSHYHDIQVDHSFGCSFPDISVRKLYHDGYCCCTSSPVQPEFGFHNMGHHFHKINCR